MTIKSAAATLGAALILAGAPALASAATTTVAPSPIHVDSVQIEQTYGIFNNLFPGLVTVAFTNQATQPVTDIVFDLESSNGTFIRQYDDAGNVQPGKSVKHAFNNSDIGANQTLAVDSVTFADGTTWSNIDAIPSRRQTEANTASVSVETYLPFAFN